MTQPTSSAAFARNEYLRTALTPIEALCLTVWGEARAESPLGIRAVAKVILNRVADGRWGRTVNSVVFRRWQFSCWIPQGGLANYNALQDLTSIVLRKEKPVLESYTKVLALVEPVHAFTDAVPEVERATHYITNSLRDSKPPAWVRHPETRLIRVIGNHTFYTAR